MGKVTVSNITGSLSFVVVRIALAMARFSVLASPLAILPPPLPGLSPCTVLLDSSPWLACDCCLSAGTLLLLTGWHPTSHRRWLASALPSGLARLSTLPDHRTPPRLPPVVVLHCLRGCRRRLGATNVITDAAVAFRFDVGPLFRWFSYMRDHYPPPQAPNEL